MQTLFSVLAGAMGGAVITALVGPAIQARRDHARWVRERRYEAFTHALEMLRSIRLLMSEAIQVATAPRPPGVTVEAALARATTISEKAKELAADWPALSAPSSILGPDTVDKALGTAGEAVGRGDPDAILAAEEKLVAAMRKSLNVKA